MLYCITWIRAYNPPRVLSQTCRVARQTKHVIKAISVKAVKRVAPSPSICQNFFAEQSAKAMTAAKGRFYWPHGNYPILIKATPASIMAMPPICLIVMAF